MAQLNVLFLSDTHLGIDSPAVEKVRRRRRGPDFFAAYHEALKPAFRGEVDLVVHGGDMFYRSQVPAGLVAAAFEPLKRLADRGIPVAVVPGNHERAEIPYPLLTAHPGITVFNRPGTVHLTLKGLRVAVSGFPHVPGDVRAAFPALAARLRAEAADADVRLLCMHQAVQGAVVGNGYRFEHAPQVVRMGDLPRGYAACLAGHIHRAQVLAHDAWGFPLAVPVVYAGSVERTSFMERDEAKGYYLLSLAPDGEGGTLTQTRFVATTTRPMVQCDLATDGCDDIALKTRIWQTLAQLPRDSVVRLRLLGPLDADRRRACAVVRRLAPATMNVELSFAS